LRPRGPAPEASPREATTRSEAAARSRRRRSAAIAVVLRDAQISRWGFCLGFGWKCRSDGDDDYKPVPSGEVYLYYSVEREVRPI
jgi:hypothetical protein